MTDVSSSRVRRLGRGELLALLSLMMASTALSIDLLLPAFGEIRAAFDMPADSSDAAATVTVFMIGLASVQMFFGPLADRFGRKPVLYVGFVLYAVGAVGAALAPNFGLLLASRFLWGVGSAGPRVIGLAIVRDSYEGDQMARLMSFVMAVFILVPVLAPSVGALIVAVAPWRAVFWFCVAYIALVALWSVRLPETLDPADRIELRFDGIRRAIRLVVTQRSAMAYAAAMTLLFAGFVSYLATSELIVDDIFGMEDQFPLVFGGLAAVMGVAALANARIVGRFGSRLIVHWVLRGYVLGAVVLVILTITSDGTPGFWVFGPALAVFLAMHALLVPNLNTLAMEPMSRVAGTASALIGTAQTGGGALLGSFIDRAYDGTVVPLSFGLMICGLLALAVVRWGAEKGADP
jgi:DHA1 family bicyclomycin/chloramphenicol resistance-like MFS transporter